jgi:molybdopterin synthase sulfur carrier subunit
MDINFYATLRPIVGQKTLTIDLPDGTTARALIDLIITRIPDLGPELLDADGNFHSHMKLFINGREVVYLEHKFETIIQPHDHIDIFPPVGGG